MIIERKYLRGVSLRDTSIPRIYLRGEAGGAPISFEGYPLEIDVPNARSMRNYTIFGNTSEDAKGVGDWDGEKFVAPIRVSSESGDTLYPSVLSSPLHKIGDIADYKESNGKEWHAFGVGSYEESGTLKKLSNFWYVANGELARKMTNETTGDYTIRAKGEGGLRYILVVLPTIVRFYFDTLPEEAPTGKFVYELATPTEVQGEPLPRLAIPKGESIVTLDTQTEPSNITAKI